ncbi:Hint domain-containing protein [Rhodobacteraceae bacterium XHP0102]|nr:Hint domain-containing protein [Rhodobacteraceae bacterium XHP0102]
MAAGAGDDTVTGGAGDDTIAGGDGADAVAGGTGNDNITGDAGDDVLDGGAGDDTLDGGADNDSLAGGAGNDSLIGGDGNDTLDGGAGNDTLLGGAGDDSIVLADGFGDDSILGGEAGETTGDTLDATGVTGDVTLGYTGDEAGVLTATDGSTATFAEIEEVILGAGNDSVDGTSSTTGIALDTGAGNDTVAGGTGNDSIAGGDGRDVLDGGDGNDTLDGGAGNDSLAGGFGRDSLIGDAGNDTLRGGVGIDTLEGGAGDDSLDGGLGNDSIIGGAGNDTVDGGDGDDFINTRTDPGLGIPNRGLTLVDDPATPGVDESLFSYPSDPNPADDEDSVVAGAGNDTVLTGDDNDTVYGGAGADRIDAGFDDDLVYGGTENDTLAGAEGRDTLYGDEGDDVLFGGLASDDPDAVAAAVFDLTDDGSATQVDPDPTNNQDLLYGGIGDDTLYGGDDADWLYGGAGDDLLDGGIDDDILFGDDGNDTLLGGQGSDTLDGGAGDDALTGGIGDDFFNISGGGNDTITDFDTTDSTDGDPTNNDFVDLSPFYNATTVAAVNAADADPSNDFANPLAMLRADAADGVIDGIIGGIDYSAEIGDINLTLQNGGAAIDPALLNAENTGVPCFVRGTMIATIRGVIPVEALRAGDKIITRDNGVQEVRWIGSRRVEAQGKMAPVQIAAGLFNNTEALWVSPNHRILQAGTKVSVLFEEPEVLIAAKHLVGVAGIDRCPGGVVDYFHILFDRHEVILSNGCWTESLHPGQQSLDGFEKEAADEILSLFPELAGAEGVAAYGASARLVLKAHEAELAQSLLGMKK